MSDLIKDDWFVDTNNFDDAIKGMKVVAPAYTYREGYQLRVRTEDTNIYLPYYQMKQLFEEYVRIRQRKEQLQEVVTRLAKLSDAEAKHD